MWKVISQLINKPSHLLITETLSKSPKGWLHAAYEKQHDMFLKTFFFFFLIEE